MIKKFFCSPMNESASAPTNGPSILIYITSMPLSDPKLHCEIQLLIFIIDDKLITSRVIIGLTVQRDSTGEKRQVPPTMT